MINWRGDQSGGVAASATRPARSPAQITNRLRHVIPLSFGDVACQPAHQLDRLGPGELPYHCHSNPPSRRVPRGDQHLAGIEHEPAQGASLGVVEHQPANPPLPPS